ncbi:hypothetical protein KHP62_01905 [Rhodobacteraceae bacterium NNCM2]|nr:hypothetical protein [Coraliihabitans acroporae]
MISSNDERRTATRRQMLAGGAALGTALAAAKGMAADDGKADFLFVQTADAMAFDADQSRLTLRGVDPTTLFFTDRPERIAGTMTTAHFIPFWSEGSDSFLSDPPNADVSIIEGGDLRQVVVELKDPVLEGHDLHYTVKIIDGDMPVEGKEVSVFIDIIGMPLTPLSFAGMRRRAWRRAVWRR